MAIGERIRFIRNLKGMTQKYLGQIIGFPEKTADIRMAQYESGTRTPKADVTEALAKALDVSPAALAVPDIDTNIGLMHTLFAAPTRSVLLKMGVTNAVVHIVLGLGISIAGPIIATWIMKKTKWLEFFVYPNMFIKR